jgi:hypothetical protein
LRRSIAGIKNRVYWVSGFLGWSFTPFWNFLIAVLFAVVLFFSTKEKALSGLFQQLFWSLLLFMVIYVVLSFRCLKWLYKEWTYYRNALGKVSYEPEGDYIYEDIRFIYLIGKSPRTDEWLRKYKLVTSDEVMRIKNFMFGVAGIGTRRIPFSELGVRALPTDQGHKRTKIHVVPYAQDVEEGKTDHWEGALVFDPELTRADKCGVELTRKAKRCEIAIVPPRGMQIEFDNEKPITHPPKAVLELHEKTSRNSGTEQLLCVFSNAVSGHYTIYVKLQ